MAVDPDKPFNREEMYLAKAAGEGTTVPDEPWSRKEAYLEKIGGRIDEAEEDISELDAKVTALATDISLKGSVADYDHLPTDAAVGDAYITEDTGIMYVWVGDKWTALNEGGGGTVFYFDAGSGSAGFVNNTNIGIYKDFELTDPVTSVEMFEAGQKGGVYFVGEYVEEEGEHDHHPWTICQALSVVDDGMVGAGEDTFMSVTDGYRLATWMRDTTSGWNVSDVRQITTTVVQTTGNSQASVMSQNAVTQMVFTTFNQDQVRIGKNAKATGSNSVAIGGDLNNGYGAEATKVGAIALGDWSKANANYSIAIGVGSVTSHTGQMDVGTTWTSAGYNNSNYRLITGVYDPQSAHDAATKGYVDTLVGNVEAALNAINNGVVL